MRELVDQLELLFWPQRGLQDDDLVQVPGAGASIAGTDPLDRNSQPRRGRPSPLGEQKVVFDQEQASSHGCRIAGRSRSIALLAIAKRYLALAIIAPGESWVEG